MGENWRVTRLKAEHLLAPELQAFVPPQLTKLAVLLSWDELGGAARVAFSGDRIAGLFAISPEHELLAYVVPAFRRQGLASDGLQDLMRRTVADRGETRFVATAKIGEPGEYVARSLSMNEVSRTDKEISFDLNVPA